MFNKKSKANKSSSFICKLKVYRGTIYDDDDDYNDRDDHDDDHDYKYYNVQSKSKDTWGGTNNIKLQHCPQTLRFYQMSLSLSLGSFLRLITAMFDPMCHEKYVNQGMDSLSS